MPTVLSGYVTQDTIYRSEQLLLCRALRQSDNMSVILKILEQNYSTEKGITALEHEYQLLKSLLLPGVFKAYEMVRDLHSRGLVLEDFGGNPIHQALPPGKTTWQDCLDFAVDLSTILHDIHAHNIIHKTLTPHTIFINQTTREVKVFGFSSASEVQKEILSTQDAVLFEENMAYIAPEQTGRMNRSLDYRSDLYSVGVILYELLTGTPPFASSDSMEMIHAIIARQPKPPMERKPSIPEVLSNIVMKLLRKNAEDRYQTASGLLYDLKKCREQLTQEGTRSLFSLGSNDAPTTLRIPEKMYGREKEYSQLLNAFLEVGTHRKTIQIISGEPGVGKTFLIRELQKPVVENQGYFLSGKFDQYKRNIPYTAIVQSLRALVEQLLTESDDRLDTWRKELLHALGENGQILLDLVPSLELIIGQQPELAPLTTLDAENRRQTVLENFFKVFNDSKHPLVLFIDDFQWADNASLKFLQSLLSDTELNNLQFIGSYRHTEVTSGHPFLLFLDQLKTEGIQIETIQLNPLDIDAITRMLRETFPLHLASIRGLAELVFSKTNGNPFFIHRFLHRLHDDGLIKFKSGWTWNLDEIKQASITDNVVELMAEAIKTFPKDTYKTIKVAACIGITFPLKTLARVMGKLDSELYADLKPAVNEGVILKQGENGLFAHDRIQEAAYSLIKENDRASIHYTIGSTLRNLHEDEESGDEVFAIASQLNSALPLLNQEEKEYLLQLNIEAGLKAKSTMAYITSVNYFKQAIELLPPDPWDSLYESTLTIYKNMVEALYLAAMLEEAEEAFKIVIKKAKSLTDKMAIYHIMLIFYQITYQADKGLELGASAVHEVLPCFPGSVEDMEKLTENDVAPLLIRFEASVEQHGVEGLLNLPPMTDPTFLGVTNIMQAMIIPVWIRFNTPYVQIYLVLSMVNLALEHGMSGLASFGFSLLGTILCETYGRIDFGFKIGRLSLDVQKKYDAKYAKPFVTLIYYNMIHYRKESFKDSPKRLRAAYQDGIESGNHLLAAYAINHYCLSSIYAGVNLATLRAEYDNLRAPLLKLRQGDALDFFEPPAQLVNNLSGLADDPTKLIGLNFNEDSEYDRLTEVGYHSSVALLRYFRLFLYCYLGDFDRGMTVVRQQDNIRTINYGQFQSLEYLFFVALTCIHSLDKVSEHELPELLQKINTIEAEMIIWNQNCPENFEARQLLVSAEKEAVVGNPINAMQLYEAAIASAIRHDWNHLEALCNERAAHFYLKQGLNRQAGLLFADAVNAYDRWGAELKVSSITEKYGHLFETLPAMPRKDGRMNVDMFDLQAVIKAYRAISSEILLDNLLNQLMHICLEVAGATRVLLIVENEEEYTVAAQYDTGDTDNECKQTRNIGECELSTSLVRYVSRTKEIVVQDNAQVEALPADNAYVAANGVKSVLCVPIFHQKDILAVVYLENNLTIGAFTPKHQEALRLIAAQAAISLQNATLYQSLREEIAERRRAEEELSESQEVFTAFMDQVPAAVFLQDEENRYLYYNLGLKELLGANDDWIGKRPDEFMPDDIWESITEPPVASLEEGGYATEERLDVDTGDTRFFNIVRFPIVRKKKSRLLGGIAWDITERKTGEDMLLKAKNYIANIIDLMPSVVIGIDINSVITHWNLHAERLSGLEKAYAEGQLLTQVMPHLERDLNTIQAAMNTATPQRISKRSRTIGKREVVEEMTIYPLITDRVEGAVIRIDDVTERVYLEQMMVQSEKMMSVGGLAAGMAHEINNPLAVIIGYAHNINKRIFANLKRNETVANECGISLDNLRNYIEKREIKSMIDGIHDSGERAARIISNMLSFSRKSEMKFEFYNVADLLDKTIELAANVYDMKKQYDFSRIQIVREYDSNVPEIQCDGNEIQQVLLNLLKNGAEAMAEKEYVGESPCFILRINQSNKMVGIEVEDNGPGMDEQVRRRILEPFYTTKPIGRGTGLGLSVSYFIVTEQHGGSLEVYSDLGKGTRFIISLPIEGNQVKPSS